MICLMYFFFPAIDFISCSNEQKSWSYNIHKHPLIRNLHTTISNKLVILTQNQTIPRSKKTRPDLTQKSPCVLSLPSKTYRRKAFLIPKEIQKLKRSTSSYIRLSIATFDHTLSNEEGSSIGRSFFFLQPPPFKIFQPLHDLNMLTFETRPSLWS